MVQYTSKQLISVPGEGDGLGAGVGATEARSVGENETTGGEAVATTAGECVVIERTASGSDELGSTLVGCRDLELITAGCEENGINSTPSDVVVAVCD